MNEVDSPDFNASIAETVLSINYSAVLDIANFIIERRGNEAETAVILFIDDSESSITAGTSA